MVLAPSHSADPVGLSHRPTKSGGEGDLIDVPFVPGFYPEMTPAVLDARLSASGYAPARARGPRFRFIDLGSGYGFNAALVAALYPDAEVVAIDPLAEHCEAQRTFAERAGLTNLSVRCLDFASLHTDDVAYDYIALNAVISWISDEDRHAAWRFASTSLAPKGCLFASFNTMPGLAGVDALRRLIKHLATLTSGDTLQRMAAAFEAVQDLASQRCAFFQQHPELLPMVEEFSTRSLNYLAHEYMTEHWHAFYVADVHAELASYGLQFAGGLCREDLTDPAAPEPTADPLADYLVDRRYRRDVFVRSDRNASEADQKPLSKATMASLIPHMSVEDQRRELAQHSPDKDMQLLSLLAMGASTVREEPTEKTLRAVDLYNRALLAPHASRLDTARPFALAGLANGFRIQSLADIDLDERDWGRLFRRHGLQV